MAETAGDIQNDPLLDVIDEKDDDIEDLNERFYDTCSLGPPNDVEDPPSSNIHNDPLEFRDPKPECNEEGVLKTQLEEESCLPIEELEVGVLALISYLLAS